MIGHLFDNFSEYGFGVAEMASLVKLVAEFEQFGQGDRLRLLRLHDLCAVESVRISLRIRNNHIHGTTIFFAPTFF